MNNIQKAFKNKAKCGLRMAAGGIIDPSLVDQQAIKAGTVDQNGSDFDTINAERTLRWASDDAAKAQKYKQPFQPSMAATDLAKGLLAQSQAAQPTQGIQPVQPAAPMETTFEQDMNARDQRIRGYGKGLGRSYADGGVIQETPDQMMARMAAKYGVGGGKPAPVQAAAPQPTPVPQPVAQPAPQPLGLRGIATGGLDRRMAAAGLAEGGIVQGKGGPTDDKVPMEVNGKPVNLSDSEAVLPAKTVKALGGPEAVEEMIEHTNGKPPVKSGLRAGGEYADGWSLGKSSAFSNDAGLDINGKKASLSPDPNRPTDPSTDGRREYSTPTAPAFVAPEGARQRAAHNAIMNTPTENTQFDLPITQADKSAGLRAQRAAEDSLSPDIKGLRAAGVVGPVQGDVTVGGKTAPTGIRTIDGANGQKIYAGRDAKGQLNVSSGAAMSAGEADAARDAAFAKAGTKKDTYGNWMSDQRVGDKAALAQIQQERTLRDAFSPDITDPNVQSDARARLGYDLAGQQVAAKGGLEQARLILDQARFNREGKQQEREQANKDKEFDFKDNEAHTKRVSDTIENWAGDPKAPDYAQRLAQLHAYAGNFKRQPGQSSDAHIGELMKNKAYDDFVNARGQHWFTPQMEQTGQPVMPKAEANSGLRSALEGAFVSKNRYRDANTEQTIYDSDVANMPKELREIHKQRLAAAKTR